MSSAALQRLPPKETPESQNVLGALIPAHHCLAEMKGMARIIPNEGILLKESAPAGGTV